MKDNQPNIMTTTNISNQSATSAVREFLAKAATTTASHPPLTIPKNTVPARDYSIQNNCRAALLKFFDDHDPTNQRNPISRRLLELISSDDMDERERETFPPTGAQTQ